MSGYTNPHLFDLAIYRLVNWTWFGAIATFIGGWVISALPEPVADHKLGTLLFLVIGGHLLGLAEQKAENKSVKFEKDMAVLAATSVIATKGRA